MNQTSAAESQLFVLRIWAEDLGDGRFEIRGQVKHVPSGESGCFREWAGLLTFLTRRLQVEGAVKEREQRVQGSG
jgi:hypothetical protein